MASVDIPQSVLSEYFQERLSGRRVLGMLFLTFEFDPVFFEQEVLPAFLDIPVSQAEVPRLLQLEAALRELPHSVAVIYDHTGLRLAEKAPKLDIRRVPARVRTGIFHPKNVFVLTEDLDPDGDGARPKRLLVAALSANLTKPGWWENVEVCHAEELAEGDTTCLRDPLLNLFKQCRERTDSPTVANVVEPFRRFVHYNLTQRGQRYQNRALLPQLYTGGQEVADFLADTIPSDSGYCLEVISPFFDKSAEATPLKRLVRRLKPEETRVFLPKTLNGEAACSPEFFDAVSDLENVTWAALPPELLRLGKGANAGARSVHAKVYRIFKRVPKREFLFIGSPNLTGPAHSAAGGNVETGFLVEVDPVKKPEFWLTVDKRRPAEFAAPDPPEDVAERESLPVQVRFSWKSGVAWGFWEKPALPPFQLSSGGIVIGRGLEWPRQTWGELPVAVNAALADALKSVSTLTVQDANGQEGKILVQEEDTALKPDLTRTLPVADILEYWALLKPEQRQAFLEAREDVLTNSEALGPMSGHRLLAHSNDMFQRCAGIFQSVMTLEQRVVEAIDAGQEAHAVALLFGERFDSLGPVIARVLKGDAVDKRDDGLDIVNRYLILLCAAQLLESVKIAQPDFWNRFSEQADRISTLVSQRQSVRDVLIQQDPNQLAPFLDWFDRWFLERVRAVEVA